MLNCFFSVPFSHFNFSRISEYAWVYVVFFFVCLECNAYGGRILSKPILWFLRRQYYIHISYVDEVIAYKDKDFVYNRWQSKTMIRTIFFYDLVTGNTKHSIGIIQRLFA